MEKVDISVKGSKKKEFFVEPLSLPDFFEFRQRNTDKIDENDLLIQLSLVDSQGEKVFKKTQLAQIQKKISGVDLMLVLMAATELNNFGKLSDFQEKYQKNS